MKSFYHLTFNIYLIAAISVISLAQEGKTDRDSNKIRFVYNNNDQLTEVINTGGNKTLLNYNERGQLVSKKNNESEEIFEYNTLDQLKCMKDNTGETLIDYNSDGRMKSYKYPSGEEIKYEYTNSGEIASVVWEGNHYLIYERDLIGNIIGLKTPVGFFSVYYDYDNRKMQRQYPNGAVSVFTYNTDGSALSIQHFGTNNKLFLELSYSYNDAGLLKNAQEKSTSGIVSINYTYDAYGQLLKAEYSDGRIYQYEYDSFGNCVKSISPIAQQLSTFDDHDQLISLNGKVVQNDVMGNIVLLDSIKYTYGSKGELISDNKYNYIYNALGMRVQKYNADHKTNFYHLIDDVPYLLAETGKKDKFYIWGDGQLLGQFDNSGVLFFFEDQLGSIRCAMDKGGNIIGYQEYSPFGEPVKKIAGISFGYAGEEQDESGKIFLRARYYEPKIGRFLSKDPKMFELTEESKQNRYTYVSNSVTNFVDPNGIEKYPPRTYIDPFKWLFNLQYAKQFYAQMSERALTRETGNWIFNGLEATMWDVIGGYIPGDNLTRGQELASIMFSVAGFHKSINAVTGIVEVVSHGISAADNFLNRDYSNAVIDLVLGSAKFARTKLVTKAEKILEGAKIPNLDVNQYEFSFIKSGIENFNKQTNIAEKILKIDALIDKGEKAKVLIDLWEALKKPFLYSDVKNGEALIPKVGGVYLNKAAEVVGNLNGIETVSFDPSGNRIIIVSSDSSSTSLPKIKIEDLAAAYRTVFSNCPTEPGVTIDPDSLNPHADSMVVRFFGDMENTHFGHVLFEADRIMKSLSLGEDNITHQPIGVKAEGYYNLLNLGFSNLGGKSNNELWSRFWLVPERVVVKVSNDKKSISFPDTKIKVKTETMKWKNGQLVSAGGEINEKAEYFAAHFTKFYDEYAKEFPVYEELKNLANIVGLMKWLKESGIHADLEWLKKYDYKYKTPEKTPSLTVSAQGEVSTGKISKLEIFGGADLTVKNNYQKDNGRIEEMKKKAIVTVASITGVAKSEFTDENNIVKNVIALPTSQTHAPGAKIIVEDDPCIVGRIFSSFNNDIGSFGFSWQLNLPSLKIIQSEKSVVSYKILGNQKVKLFKFRLTDPLGIKDVVFESDTIDEQKEKICFIPETLDDIKCLYPGNDNSEYHIEYFDDRNEVFDSEGRIIRLEYSPEQQIKYFYDKAGKLIAIEKTDRNKTISDIKLFYDSDNRIISAIGCGKSIKYNYNSQGNLDKVIDDDNVLEYSYDDNNLVTEVRLNDLITDTIEYDSLGRIVNQFVEGESKGKTEISSSGGQTVVKQNFGAKQLISKYDAAGRLLEKYYPSSGILKKTYDEAGSIALTEFQNEFGDKTKIEYSPDKRYSKFTNSEGNIRAVLHDELGRIKQIQDGKNVLVNYEYAQTSKGWAKNMETTDLKTQTIYNKGNKPIQQLITAKNKSGGQIIRHAEYDKNGLLQNNKTSGLFNEEIIFKNSRLETYVLGKKSSTYFYDNSGRLNELKSSGNRLKISYDSTDNIDNLSSQAGKFVESIELKNGKILKRKTNSGLNDLFQYEDDSILKEVKRNDGETWVIDRNGNRTTFLRNNVVQMQFIVDEKGRLIEMVY